MDVYFDPEKDKLFEAVFGRSVVAWNHVEYELRSLLTFLASDRNSPTGFGALILVAEMGAWRLSETLKTFADAMLKDEEEKALVKHVGTLFEKLIPYRNHYVHGLLFVTSENVGCIGGTTAKGQLKNVHGDVAIEEIGKFLDKVGELDDFLYDVREYLKPTKRQRRLASWLFKKKRPPVPDKPEPITALAKETIILPHGMGR